MKRFFGFLCLIALLPAFCLPAAGVELELAGKSAVLMDAATGTVIYEHNAHEPLAPASVTKVMTMLLIMEAIDGGKIGWDDMVTASEAAAAKGGSQIYLKVGESMSVTDMLKSIAVSSANDCACAMAEHIAGSESAFVERMNKRAAELQMNETHFVNCTGLDDAPDADEHLTSAYDIAIMSRELIVNHPDIKKFTTIWMDTVRNGAFGLSNTNKLVRFYSGATGLKTGFTAAAGYCLSATAQRDGMELIAVVMGAKTSGERNAACKALLDYGFANFSLIDPGLEAVPKVPVKLGSAQDVELELGENGNLLIDKGKKGTVTTEIRAEPFTTAPVAKGAKLGTLTIRSGDEVLRELPLVAKEQVERVTFGQLFVKILRRVAMAKEVTAQGASE